MLIDDQFPAQDLPDQRDAGIHHLAQIVRRMLGGHATAMPPPGLTRRSGTGRSTTSLLITASYFVEITVSLSISSLFYGPPRRHSRTHGRLRIAVHLNSYCRGADSIDGRRMEKSCAMRTSAS